MTARGIVFVETPKPQTLKVFTHQVNAFILKNGCSSHLRGDKCINQKNFSFSSERVLLYKRLFISLERKESEGHPDLLGVNERESCSERKGSSLGKFHKESTHKTRILTPRISSRGEANLPTILQDIFFCKLFILSNSYTHP